MDHYYVTLEGFPAESGRVTSKGDKVIGTYTCDENDYLEFIPEGQSQPIISGYHVGPFCSEIAAWHEVQQT